MEEEQKITPQEEEQELPNDVIEIDRVLNLAFNIDKAEQMIDGAHKLASFVDILEQKIGLLSLNLNVSINPFEDKDGNKGGTIGYKTTDVYGEKVEVENEFDYDDDNEPDEILK